MQYQVHRHQAAVAALLGQRERAVHMLRQEPARNSLWMLLHTDADLASIRDHPFVVSVLHPTG